MMESITVVLLEVDNSLCMCPTFTVTMSNPDDTILVPQSGRSLRNIYSLGCSTRPWLWACMSYSLLDPLRATNQSWQPITVPSGCTGHRYSPRSATVSSWNSTYPSLGGHSSVPCHYSPSGKVWLLRPSRIVQPHSDVQKPYDAPHAIHRWYDACYALHHGESLKCSTPRFELKRANP